MDNKPLEQLFVDALRKMPPDFSEAERLLHQGADINAVSPEDHEENLLSGLILGYPESRFDGEALCEKSEDISCEGCPLYMPIDGRYLPQIIRFCLEHGFDVSEANGTAGAKCLHNLTFSSYDDYILEGMKLLLDAGADPEVDPYPDETAQSGYLETLLSWIAIKCSGAVAADGDYELRNRFCAMYDILDAAIKGCDYHAVFNCYPCIGKKVQRIALCCAEDAQSSDIDSGEGYRPPAPIVFDCEGLPLYLHNRYAEAYVGLLAASEISERTAAASPLLTWCLGRTITDIVIAPQGYEDSRPVSITISFDNGNALYVAYDKAARITVVPAIPSGEGGTRA